MSLPSAAEQATIDRFGAFNEEKFALIVAHANDHLPCAVDGCVKTAGWRLSTRCCGATVVLCNRHWRRESARLRRALRGRLEPLCVTCGHIYPERSPLLTIVRVVRI